MTALEQQADLGGRAGAELDQRRAFGEEACDFAAPVAQNAEFGAGRVIFRQYRDLFEQFGTGRVIEILGRQAFRMLRQVADHVAGKSRGLFVELLRSGQSGGMHIHDTLLNALSGALLVI